MKKGMYEFMARMRDVTMPFETRLDVRTLAELAEYFRGQGEPVTSRSQVIRMACEVLREFAVLHGGQREINDPEEALYVLEEFALVKSRIRDRKNTRGNKKLVESMAQHHKEQISREDIEAAARAMYGEEPDVRKILQDGVVDRPRQSTLDAIERSMTETQRKELEREKEKVRLAREAEVPTDSTTDPEEFRRREEERLRLEREALSPENIRRFQED